MPGMLMGWDRSPSRCVRGSESVYRRGWVRALSTLIQGLARHPVVVTASQGMTDQCVSLPKVSCSICVFNSLGGMPNLALKAREK